MEFSLLSTTPSVWCDAVLSDFDAFLIDHAACEQKAAAVGLSFVSRYPDRPALLGPMIQFAREELRHFHDVYRLIEARGLTLRTNAEDAYAQALLGNVRFSREERFLDRLLVAAMIEARSHERLALLADRLEDDGLRRFYGRLSRAESAHRTFFVGIALKFFPESVVAPRLRFWLEREAEAIAAQPLGPRVH
jgi:tRNA-(ms[2]io[6]A)-hydroxylase